MSGIFGAINLKEYYNIEYFYKFIKLTNLVDYRGPDSFAYTTLDFNIGVLNKNNFNVFLGQRKLTIKNMNNPKNQSSQKKDTYIIYDGEIFNYFELRKELESKGYSFKTNTDEEVILKTYSEFGNDGFKKFNGMWAFIIVDLLKNKVIISRDKFSIKPLYFLHKNNCFYFASEIKQLIPLLEKKRINKNVMFSFLHQALLDYNDETFFKQINRLKPKINLIIDLNTSKVEEKQYWNYELEEITDEDVALEKFRNIFYDSVKIRLEKNIKIGCLLSGGLDSSAICVIANNIIKENFETFSVVGDDEKYSEKRFIDILVKEKNIKNTKLTFQPNMVLNYINEVLTCQDEPFGSFSAIAQYLSFNKIKSETDIKIILSGQGGDEVLMGYLKYYFFYLKDLIKKGKLTDLVKQIFLSLINRTVIYQLKLSDAKRYIPFLAKNKLDYIMLEGSLEPIWKCDNLLERQILDIERYSIPALTRYEDRNSMANSIEVRNPFLDDRLVNFYLSLPVSFKLKNGWTKYILRRAIYELPKDIKERRDKQGFITPEEKWLRHNFESLIVEKFKDSILDEMGIINKKNFLIYYKNFLSGKSIIDYAEITRVLIAELWARKFLI